jgi:hypothetical protein
MKREDPNAMPQSHRRADLLSRGDMTFLAIVDGKGYGVVTEATVLAAGYLKHGVLHGPLLDTRKDVRMTDLATIPQGVLLVRKENISCPITF